MSSHSPSLELRIRAEGELSSALVAELAGLTLRRTNGDTTMRGHVVDSSAIWGLLHRLERAGLRLRSFERFSPPVPDPQGASAAQSARGERSGVESGSPGSLPDDPLVFVEVEGSLASILSVTVPGTNIFQRPASTTLALPLSAPEALFDTLWVLEDLAVEIRDIRIVG